MSKQVIQFLRDPIKTGVYSARLTVSYNGIMACFKYCKDIAKAKRKRLKVTEPDNNRESYRFLSATGEPYFMDRTLDFLLNFLVKHDDSCPKEIKDWTKYGDIVVFPKYYDEADSYVNHPDFNFFFAQQTYFEDVFDALSITIDDKAGPDLVAEIASLNEGTLKKFSAFVSSIPMFGENVLFKEEGLQHTQASVFNLYPAVLGLWVDTLAHRDVKRDTIDYLGDALRYFDKKEWRMVIILCALSTESVLADVYEDLAKKEAPEAPLGALVAEIEKYHKFPSDVSKCIKLINDIRISALHHKGLSSLTRREALLSLISTTQISLWWSFNVRILGKQYQQTCKK